MTIAPASVQSFLGGLDSGKMEAAYASDQHLFYQDEPCDAIYYLTSGKVKLTVLSAQGKEAVVAVVNSGEFFGEGCLAGQRVRLASAVTLVNSIIIKIEKGAMVRALRNRPEFSEKFMAYLLARNARVEADLVDQLFNSSEKRLARALLLLANVGKDADPEPVLAHISQETFSPKPRWITLLQDHFDG
jgi:CRP-like cAMP-binding protein